MVLAPDTLIAKNPAAVQAFVEASAVGWKNYLYGDPKPADALILKDNPDMTEDVLAQARDKMRPVSAWSTAAMRRRSGIGAMTDPHWADFFKIASTKGAGELQGRLHACEFLPNPPVK